MLAHFPLGKSVTWPWATPGGSGMCPPCTGGTARPMRVNWDLNSSHRKSNEQPDMVVQSMLDSYLTYPSFVFC